MEEEAKEEEGDEEDSPPKKRVRTGIMILDEEEADIASGLRPIQKKRPSVSSLQEDMDGSQIGPDSGAENGEGTVDDHSGDGHGVLFENNGVRLSNLLVVLIYTHFCNL